MMLIDRVVCDCCYCVMGQLFTTTAVRKDAINNLSVSPYFSVCPDCQGFTLDNVVSGRTALCSTSGDYYV